MAGNAGLTGARLGPILGGGNANVTRLVECAQGRFVLRHPPAATISDTAASGMAREFRVTSALAGRAPVAAPVAFCDDPEVIGAPFMVSQFVDGVAITECLPEAYADNARTVSAIGEALVDALAAVHVTDWRDALGSGFGRPDGFLERQVQRWMAVRGRDQVRDLPLLDALGEWLAANLPEPAPAAIVHCDYHLDNTLFDRAAPRLRAIIDCEMATIADPRVDVGLLTMFWNRAESSARGFGFVQRVSNRPGVVPAQELAQRWSSATGIGLSDFDWFRAFAFWRLAAIVEGAYVLFRRGEIDSAYARGLETDVPALLREASEVLG
jgi:aminoglycoside phosphotransferase (APT) family kinase protein